MEVICACTKTLYKGRGELLVLVIRADRGVFSHPDQFSLRKCRFFTISLFTCCLLSKVDI